MDSDARSAGELRAAGLRKGERACDAGEMSNESSRTLLVLGCGYLGRRIVATALEQGLRVKAVSKNEASLEEVARLGAETCQAWVDGATWHAFAGEGVDWVVNCVSSAGGGLEGYRRSYVEGNRSLAAWARSAGFGGKAIYTSSVSVYPDAGGGWVDERCSSEPSNERGKIVRESEQVFLDGVARGSGYVLRLAGLYGPGRHLMLNTLREGPEEIPGWGDYHLNLVRIEDVESAVWSVLNESELKPGVYNVIDDRPSLKEEMVAWIADRLKIAKPRFTGKPGGGRASSRRLGEGGRPADRRISNASLKASSGWRPRYSDYRKGFGELIDRPLDSV
ncbi:NAD-dependent epimerase/dehydratase family protein [Pelagicoccus sp. SDUM812003]|uniref:NAD-dependent epimerase/dehydratase family protein n=1 Tax=Pelagicoccus sp. SDUM812003 TaxID=3041267 RepID=UPI00280EF3AF|nr:NAD-dependent epimerase/dehydratase family protein [Pelagicoccus sp. SDUM812003]MDQ8203721.1 NAD-dependent epimerase/dehydratase family protein [Pelagicoccus sp. SDUM812003]